MLPLMSFFFIFFNFNHIILNGNLHGLALTILIFVFIFPFINKIMHKINMIYLLKLTIYMDIWILGMLSDSKIILIIYYF